MANQLTDSTGNTVLFEFFGRTIQNVSVNLDRDLFTIEIPFQRDPLVEDFVDTKTTISIQGMLITTSGGNDSDAYNSTNGGGCFGQLNQLLSLTNNRTVSQDIMYLTISSYGGLLTLVPCIASTVHFEVVQDQPNSAINFSLELVRADESS
jgi:hypothetical protein